MHNRVSRRKKCVPGAHSRRPALLLTQREGHFVSDEADAAHGAQGAAKEARRPIAWIERRAAWSPVSHRPGIARAGYSAGIGASPVGSCTSPSSAVGASTGTVVTLAAPALAPLPAPPRTKAERRLLVMSLAKSQ